MKILKVTNNETGDNAASFKTPEKTQTTNSLAMMESQVFTIYDLSPIHLQSTIPHNVIPNTTSYNNMMPSDEISSTVNNAILRLILEKVSATLAYVQRIDEKLSTGSVMTNNNIAINDEFLNLFPERGMKEVVSVEEIENKLSTEIEFENQMTNNTNNYVKRIFGRLFSNQLAVKYSWTGFRNNCQLQNLYIITIIKNIALKTFNSTEVEFENHVKNWFRHGQQRLSRKQK